MSFLSDMGEDETHFVDLFIEGLRPGIGSVVRRCNPKSLWSAYCLAKWEESKETVDNNNDIAVLDEVSKAESIEVKNGIVEDVVVETIKESVEVEVENEIIDDEQVRNDIRTIEMLRPGGIEINKSGLEKLTRNGVNNMEGQVGVGDLRKYKVGLISVKDSLLLESHEFSYCLDISSFSHEYVHMVKTIGDFMVKTKQVFDPGGKQVFDSGSCGCGNVPKKKLETNCTSQLGVVVTCHVLFIRNILAKKVVIFFNGNTNLMGAYIGISDVELMVSGMNPTLTRSFAITQLNFAGEPMLIRNLYKEFYLEVYVIKELSVMSRCFSKQKLVSVMQFRMAEFLHQIINHEDKLSGKGEEEEERPKADTKVVPELVHNEIVDTELVPELMHTEVGIELAGDISISGNSFKQRVGGNVQGVKDTFMGLAVACFGADVYAPQTLCVKDSQTPTNFEPHYSKCNDMSSSMKILVDNGFKISIVVETKMGVDYLENYARNYTKLNVRFLLGSFGCGIYLNTYSSRQDLDAYKWMQMVVMNKLHSGFNIKGIEVLLSSLVKT
ncbi:hypothetical protein Tco_1388396 [Tanacetum coccineum]